MLACLKGEGDNYWSLMNIDGNIEHLPYRLHRILNSRQWQSLEIKKQKKDGSILIVVSEKPENQEKIQIHGILINS